MTDTFPLNWPVGRLRATHREVSRFDTSWSMALDSLRYEIRKLGGTGLVISSNVPLTAHGFPSLRSTGRITDPGVAVYFTLHRKPMCFACDRWTLVEDNTQAIAKTIQALRGIERWGSGSMVSQAFTGFVALPAPEQPWQVLGLNTSRPTLEQVELAHRKLAGQHHPDRGGDTDYMARINAARDALYAELMVP